MSLKVANGLDVVNKNISNVAAPSAGTDAANKDYVDALVRGLPWKEEVRAVTTGNITLSATQTIDGVVLVANDRVLVKDQTTQTANGVYLVAAGAWTRALDADSPSELAALAVTVLEGTTNAGRVYTVASTVADPIVIGTTNLVFTQVGGAGQAYTAGNGLTLAGADFNVGAGTGISVAADTVSIDTSVVARKFTAAIGNGSLTSMPVVHNLNTRDVQVDVYDAASFETVLADIVRTDANTVTVNISPAPTASQYRVVVIG